YYFFDNISLANTSIHNKFPLLKTFESVQEVFTQNPDFCLGLRGAKVRRYIYDRFIELGRGFKSLKPQNGFLSPYAINQSGMVHAKAAVGLGTLINAGASIHHEVHVGKFC